MSSSAKAYMLEQMERYFIKIKNTLTANSSLSKFTTGTIEPNSTINYDAFQEFGVTTDTHNPMSMTVNITVIDPNDSTSAIPNVNRIDFSIKSSGTVVVRNWSNIRLTYHMVVTKPLAR